MGKIVYSRTFDAPIEATFDYLISVDKRKNWQKTLQSAEKLTSGPEGEGTRIRETFLTNGKPMVVELEYTEFERPHRLVEKVVTPMSTADVVLQFESKGNKTVLTETVMMKWNGAFKLLGPLLDKVFKKGMVKDFEELNGVLKTQ